MIPMADPVPALVEPMGELLVPKRPSPALAMPARLAVNVAVRSLATVLFRPLIFNPNSSNFAAPFAGYQYGYRQICGELEGFEKIDA